MDEALVVALRAFLTSIQQRISDEHVAWAVEKTNSIMRRLSEGQISATEAAQYMRHIVTVVS